MPAELTPSPARIAEATLRELRAGRTVYVEGPAGSGRTGLLALLSAEPGTCAVDLLPIREVDCSAMALLEARAGLRGANLPSIEQGSPDEYFKSGQAIAEAAGDAGRLVLRLPGSWSLIAERFSRDHAWLRNAQAWLSGLLKAGRPIAIVADAAINPHDLGIHAQTRFQLPAHRTPSSALEHVSWGTYRAAFEELSREAGPTHASPLEWRLAVGAVQLGMSSRKAVAALRNQPALATLWTAIIPKLAAVPALANAAKRLALVRRAIPRATLEDLVAAPEPHGPLFLECLAYGDHLSSISTPIRDLLLRRFRSGSTSAHARLAAHYRELDGATEPSTSSPGAARAWGEKVHHLSSGGAAEVDEWKEQAVIAPEQLWERARALSLSRHHADAARVYRASVERFPQDAYGWHYYAWNLEKVRGDRNEIGRGFEQAVKLDPENPWWNSRLVTYFIASAQPARAREEWRRAVARTDPDGDGLSTSPWLADHMHRWVARDWLRSGRPAWAAEVVATIPSRTLRTCDPSTRRIAKEARQPGEPRRWGQYLESLEHRAGITHDLATRVRGTWSQLRAAMGNDLPLPLAGRTASGEAFQFCWRYEGLSFELDIHHDGMVEWFAEAGDLHDGSNEPETFDIDRLRTWMERVTLGR